MSGAYTITPQPRAGQQGPAWLRWLDRYAQEHAAAAVQMTVRDFPPSVRTPITVDEDGESSTTSEARPWPSDLLLVHRAHDDLSPSSSRVRGCDRL